MTDDDNDGFDEASAGRALARLGYDVKAEQERVAARAREMSESLCIPSWWKAELSRFHASEQAAAPKCSECNGPLGSTTGCRTCAGSRV